MKIAGVISLCLLIALTGCDAGSEIERGMALRSALLQSEETGFQASIEADYGEKSHHFSMDCRFDGQGNMSFTVLKPDSVADITGEIVKTGGKLTFTDAAVYFEPMTDGQISPVMAPWILMKTLRSGCLTSVCTEDGLLRMTMDDSFADDALHADIWINGENIPVRGEILYGGRRILSLTVENFRIL